MRPDAAFNPMSGPSKHPGTLNSPGLRHDGSQWPRADEAVDHRWALEAIESGHGPTIARYLRENEKPDPRVIRAVADILDPDPTLEQPLRAHLRRRRRGRPRPPSFHNDRTAMLVRFANAEPKVEAGVARLQELGISRATVFRKRRQLGLTKKIGGRNEESGVPPPHEEDDLNSTNK